MVVVVVVAGAGPAIPAHAAEAVVEAIIMAGGAAMPGAGVGGEDTAGPSR